MVSNTRMQRYRPSALIAFLVTGLVLVAPAGAYAALPAIYGGTTVSGPGPIVIVGDPTRQHVRSLVVGLDVECGDERYWDAERLAVVAGTRGAAGQLGTSRNSGGRFAGETVTDVMRKDGSTATIRITVSGQIGRENALGTLSGKVLAIQGVPQPASRCPTKRYSWRARRDPGRIYGGASSQGEPVVLELSNDRKSVKNLYVTWHVPACRPVADWRLPDALSDFPIKHGAFGDSFEQRYRFSKNRRLIFEYDIAGRMASTRSSARGSFKVRLGALFYDLPALVVCETGTLTWSTVTG